MEYGIFLYFYKEKIKYLSMDKLFLLDAYALIYRAYYALIKNQVAVDFLAVQWLGLCLPMQGVWAQSLLRELGSHIPQD